MITKDEIWASYYAARWKLQKPKIDKLQALEMPSPARITHGDESVFVFDVPDSFASELKKLGLIYRDRERYWEYPTGPLPMLEQDLPPIVFNNGKVFQKSVKDPQLKFLECQDKFACMRGSIGSGKSAAGTAKVIFQSFVYPDNFGFVVMKTMSQSKKSAVRDFFDMLPDYLLISSNKSQSEVEAVILNSNGWKYAQYHNYSIKDLRRPSIRSELESKEVLGTSTVIFTSFQGTVDALQKYASANIGFYMIDQAEIAAPAIYTRLADRMRRENSARQAWFLANRREDIPNEFDWLWRYFSPESADVKPQHWYIEVVTDDLKSELPVDYYDSLEYTRDAKDYALYVSGNEDEMEMTKTVFTEYSPIHNVVRHVDPPQHWKKGVGLDHGLDNPTAIVEIALLPSGEVYVFSEYEQDQGLISDHAKYLGSIKTPMHQYWGIDLTTRNREPIAHQTVIAEYHRFGLPFIPSAKDPVAGVNRLREYMKFDSNRKNPFTGEMGSPMLFISSRCTKLQLQVMGYRFEELKTHIGFRNNPEKFRKYKDHLVDALRFIHMLISYSKSAASSVEGFDVPRAPILNPSVPQQKFHDDKGNLNFDNVRKDALRPQQDYRPNAINRRRVRTRTTRRVT